MNMKQILQNAKMSKAEFSRKIKVDAGLVSKWISEERPLPDYAIVALEHISEGKELNIDDIKNNIAKNMGFVKRLTSVYGVTQRDIAKRLDVSKPTISRWASNDDFISKRAFASLKRLEEDLIKEGKRDLITSVCQVFKINQAQLAKKLNVTSSTISDWSNNSIPKMAKLALELMIENHTIKKEKNNISISAHIKEELESKLARFSVDIHSYIENLVISELIK